LNAFGADLVNGGTVAPFHGCRLSWGIAPRHSAATRKSRARSREPVFLLLEPLAFGQIEIPDSLKERLALSRENGRAYQQPQELFRIDSWAMVLLGQRMVPRGYHHLAELMPEQQLRDELARIQRGIRQTVSAMPGHPEFLRSYCPAEAPASR